MAWCEANRVDFLFGLARNQRLEQAISSELMQASLDSLRTGRPARRFKDFLWSTLDSWSRDRRVIGKAEVTGGEANLRFFVTSLKPTEVSAQHLYEVILLRPWRDGEPLFADRPERIAGHIRMVDYLKEWTSKAGSDNFHNNPPNATVSVFEPGNATNTLAVVTISNPKVEGADLVYNYGIIGGTLPAAGGATSLFIDWIGIDRGNGSGLIPWD